MAATVASRNTYVSSTSDASSFDLSGNMPASISAGDLLIVVCAVDGNPTVTAGEDWNKIPQASNGSTVTGVIFWKFAAGSDTITVATSSAQQMSAVLLRITGAGTPTATSANGSSTNSNPPNHSSGDTATLWIATRSGDSTVVATVAPTNYGNLQTATAGGTSGASTNTAERTTSATSENPGTFTSNTEQWVSFTIGIPDQPTDKAFLTGYGYDDVDNQSGHTFSVYIPFNNSTLIAGINTYDGTDETLGRVSSITYNGNAMSLQQSRVENNGADGGASYLYALTGLSAGTANLVITLAGNTDSPAFLWAVYANSASSIDTSDLDTDSTSGATVSGSITTVADKCMVFSFVDFNNVGGGNATGSDQQQIASINGGFTVISFSKTAKTPAGAVTHDYTPSANDTGEVYSISIKPYVAAGPTSVKTVNGLAIASVKTINGLAIASVKTINGLA